MKLFLNLGIKQDQADKISFSKGKFILNCFPKDEYLKD